MQRLVLEIKERNTMDIESKTNESGIKSGKFTKTQPMKTLKYYMSGRNVTCIITGLSAKAVGVAMCHEDDEFDLPLGCKIAEFRARAEWYKLMAERSYKMQF